MRSYYKFVHFLFILIILFSLNIKQEIFSNYNIIDMIQLKFQEGIIKKKN